MPRPSVMSAPTPTFPAKLVALVVRIDSSILYRIAPAPAWMNGANGIAPLLDVPRLYSRSASYSITELCPTLKPPRNGTPTLMSDAEYPKFPTRDRLGASESPTCAPYTAPGALEIVVPIGPLR